MIGDPRAGGGRGEEALPLRHLLILTLAIYRIRAVSPPLGLATMEMEDGGGREWVSDGVGASRGRRKM
jgi:hypothetical protein